MKNRANTRFWIILPIVLFFLLSCATTGQKQTESSDPKFYNNRGIDYGKKGQYDQAISDYTKAIDLNPRDDVAYYNRGVAHAAKGQYDQSIFDCSKAVEINPNFAEAYLGRAVAYYFRKKYDRSWEDIKRAEALGYKIPPKFLEELRKASGRQN